MPRLEQLQDAYSRGEISRAFLLVKDELRTSPDDGRAWEWLGVIQFRRARFAISVSALERASLLRPLQAASRVCLAIGYGKIGRRELSRELLASCIEDPTIAVKLLLQVAMALNDLDRPGDAMQACREACRRDPDFAQAYYDLGFYAARCGHPPRITESLVRRAINLDTENICFRVGLATFLVRQNHVVRAYQVIQRFSAEEIGRIRCHSCLERMAEIYGWFDDPARSELCQVQLQRLSSHPHPSDEE